MKILHITNDITVAFGGPVNSMNNIIKIWLSAGHAVQVLAIERDGKTVSIHGILKSVRPSFPTRLGNSNAAASWLAHSFAQFDVVLIHNVWAAINLRSALFLRRQRRPYVMIPHGTLDPFDLQKKSLLKSLLGPLLIRLCLEGSSAVLCSSPREADCLVTYGAKCRKMVLPWPVSPVHSQMDRQQARKALKIRDDEFVVLSLGRIDYKKGFPVLLPAVKRLLEVNSNVKLLVVGPDSRGYTKVVQRLVNQLGLQGAVTFVPPVVGEDKMRLQRAADCFALPSLNENFGNTVVEAMQQGLPCVISNNVYICGELEQGGAALVCNYDDKEVFAALRRLSESPELRAKMSAAAMRVAKNFEPEVLKERYLAMLQVIAGTRG
jgi:glycosyltransferase involved in cell wall biosynthesis